MNQLINQPSQSVASKVKENSANISLFNTGGFLPGWQYLPLGFLFSSNSKTPKQINLYMYSYRPLLQVEHAQHYSQIDPPDQIT